MVADWQSLIEELDSNETVLVHMKIDDVCKRLFVEGDEPLTALTKPPYGVGYWRHQYVKKELESRNWSVYLVDWDEGVLLFRRLRPRLAVDDDPERSQVGAHQQWQPQHDWVGDLRDLLRDAREFGTVTSIVVTKDMADGTKVRLSVEEGSVVSPSDHGGREIPHPRVSAERPIRDLPSDIAPKGTKVVQSTDTRPLRWLVPRDWVDLDKVESYEKFKGELRQRVFFGVENRTGLGGHGALATMSRKKSQQTGDVAAYSPAALGLRQTHDEEALYNLVAQGKLTINSIIGTDFNKPGSIQIEVVNRRRRPVRLRLSIGTVFEQKDAPHVQDLLVKEDLSEMIEPGGKKTLKAYGLCLDHDGNPPNGEELLLTPWTLAADVDSQEALWAATDRKGDKG